MVIQADGHAGIGSLLQKFLSLGTVLLVVQLGACLGVPGRLLREQERRIDPVEILVAKAGGHDRFHVERRLHGLAKPLVGEQPLLVVEDGHRPRRGFDDLRDHAGHRLDPIVLILLDLLTVVVLARLHAREAHGHLRHRDEEDLVEVGGALAAKEVGRLGTSAVVLEADQLDVAIGLMLDEAIGARADVVLDGPVARGVDDLLGIDGGRVVGMGEADEERGHGLLQVQGDGGGVLRLDPFHVFPDRLPATGELGPVPERGHDIGRRHLLAVVELHPAPELEGVRPSLVADGVPLGEHGDGRIVLVVGVERLVHVPGDLLGDHGRGSVRVERGWLPDHGRLEDAAYPRLVLGVRDGGRDQGPGHRAEDTADDMRSLHDTLLFASPEGASTSIGRSLSRPSFHGSGPTSSDRAP